MAFECLSTDYLQELENLSTTPMTQEEMQYIEMKQALYDIENRLQELNTSLCLLVSKVCNIITVLNGIQNCVILRDN